MQHNANQAPKGASKFLKAGSMLTAGMAIAPAAMSAMPMAAADNNTSVHQSQWKANTDCQVKAHIKEQGKVEDRPNYVVQKGDTLNSIAKAYQTTAAELASTYGISNPNLIFAGFSLSQQGQLGQAYLANYGQVPASQGNSDDTMVVLPTQAASQAAQQPFNPATNGTNPIADGHQQLSEVSTNNASQASSESQANSMSEADSVSQAFSVSTSQSMANLPVVNQSTSAAPASLSTSVAPASQSTAPASENPSEGTSQSAALTPTDPHKYDFDYLRNGTASTSTTQSTAASESAAASQSAAASLAQSTSASQTAAIASESVSTSTAFRQQGTPASNVVDISSNNGIPSVADFQKMKAQGVTQVIVKLTESSSYKNPYAAQQIANAQAAGLQVGTYHYSWYTDQASAVQEANYYAGYAKNLNLPGNTLMANDLEDSSTKTANVTANSIAFNNTMKANGYNNNVLYTYSNYAKTSGLNTDYIGNDHVWMANYNADSAQNNEKYGMWQWTQEGKFNGVKGNFDISEVHNSSLFNQ
ncbi:GH25 family lysozyme [Eupransor demetentiae]|uniref:Lysozyme n=1 Tax=Eupransor demetentiae TaxID=3109584 RepID=A0ABP0ESV6_9LACO|nr:Glucan-binding domain (YG repeat) [Lactobacillaceae bacterium LMG 33000]